MYEIVFTERDENFDNTRVRFKRYSFSKSFYIEFSDLISLDYAKNEHKGKNQFRIDYTLRGRFECEFLDGSFAYSGPNEITILATPENENWLISGSIPTKYHKGCVVLIELDKLEERDYDLFSRFNIDLNKLIKDLDIIQKWHKVDNPDEFVEIFTEIYNAEEQKDYNRLLIKSIEILLLVSELSNNNQFGYSKAKYYSGKKVQKVKRIHEYILENYDQSISFESLVPKYDIGYTQFNTIFKEIYGISPYQYLKKHRIYISCKKLKDTDQSIIDIANSVGYSNASKFSNAFKSIMNTTPNKYRNKNRINRF
ncbi:MAG: AraC family transcriptional regulator [Tissierellia bacterium]|nr:AraC family transcriptional regulator [Tissierellia bacterium]